MLKPSFALCDALVELGRLMVLWLTIQALTIGVMPMLMALFNEAFHEFLGRERRNIEANISERNLCGRLMLYLEAARIHYELTDYFTDTEYNRNLGDIKRIRHSRTKSNIITC